MTEKLTGRIEENLRHEEAIDRWWASHSKSLKETLDQYQIYLARELRRTQASLAQMTEERNELLKRLGNFRRRIDRAKEALDDR